MNKQHLQNLIALAELAISTGRITQPDELIAVGHTLKAAKETLLIMQEGQVLTVLDVKPAPATNGKAKAVKMNAEPAETKEG